MTKAWDAKTRWRMIIVERRASASDITAAVLLIFLDLILEASNKKLVKCEEAGPLRRELITLTPTGKTRPLQHSKRKWTFQPSWIAEDSFKGLVHSKLKVSNIVSPPAVLIKRPANVFHTSFVTWLLAQIRPLRGRSRDGRWKTQEQIQIVWNYMMLLHPESLCQ